MRNPVYEQTLNGEGVQWTYLDRVPVEEINAQAGIRNQARLDNPVDEELQASYAERMKAGDEFPALVLHRPSPRGRYVPIDGNQRLGASQRPGVGLKSWDAYLVQCDDPVVIDRITWTFNNRVNGKRLTVEEAMEHALHFVLKYGWECEAAARQWGIAAGSLKNRVQGEKVKAILDKAKVRRGPSFTVEHYKRLAPLLKFGDDVLEKFGQVIADNGLSTVDTMAVVGEYTGARTSASKQRVLENLIECELVKQRRAETAGGKIRHDRPSVSSQLLARLGQVESLLKNHDRRALVPAGRAYQEARERAGAVADALIVTFGLGARRKEAVG